MIVCLTRSSVLLATATHQDWKSGVVVLYHHKTMSMKEDPSCLERVVKHLLAAVGLLVAWNAVLTLFAYFAVRENQRMICHATEADRLLGRDCEFYFSGSMLSYSVILGVCSLLLVVGVLVFLVRAVGQLPRH